MPNLFIFPSSGGFKFANNNNNNNNKSRLKYCLHIYEEIHRLAYNFEKDSSVPCTVTTVKIKC